MNFAPYSIETARQRAVDALRNPPPLARLVRPVPKGGLVARFVAPLDLLKRQNWSRHRQTGELSRVKKELAYHMRCQNPGLRSPLPGRPFVRCIRFSSVEPDVSADTFKMCIDLLCMPNLKAPMRLNFLRDDRPRDAEIHQTWEPAPQGGGFGLIEVFTGDPFADIKEKRRRIRAPKIKNAPGTVAAVPGAKTRNRPERTAKGVHGGS